MMYEKLEILSRIYNTLLLVNTKGEDTMIMADCLKSLSNFINSELVLIKQAQQDQKEEE